MIDGKTAAKQYSNMFESFIVDNDLEWDEQLWPEARRQEFALMVRGLQNQQGRPVL